MSQPQPQSSEIPPRNHEALPAPGASTYTYEAVRHSLAELYDGLPLIMSALRSQIESQQATRPNAATQISQVSARVGELASHIAQLEQGGASQEELDELRSLEIAARAQLAAVWRQASAQQVRGQGGPEAKRVA